MKTLELEIVQGFFFYPHYAFRYIFVKLDFGLSCNSWGIKFSQFPSCIYLWAQL